LETPYDTEIHAYPDEGPFNDRDLKPILTRMGFRLASGGNNLQFNRRLVEDEEDLLTAVLILPPPPPPFSNCFNCEINCDI